METNATDVFRPVFDILILPSTINGVSGVKAKENRRHFNST